MSEQTPVSPDEMRAVVTETCDHFYASEHEPGHELYWIRRCMTCRAVDWDDLDGQVRAAVAAERERIRQVAIRNAAVCTGEEGTSCYFADLIRESP